MEFRTLDLLLRCSREFSSKRLHSSELNDTECLICTYVSKNSGCTQDAAASALKLNKTTVAKDVSQLEKQGLIRRTVDKIDRRKKHLFLTDVGCEKISGLLDIHERWFSQVMEALTEDEQKQFESSCEKLLLAAEKLNLEQAEQ